jgi:hypothetical protein
MEVRKIITETIICRDEYGGRSLRARKIKEENLEWSEEKVLRETLREAFLEASQEIKILFDVHDEYSFIFPDHKICLEIIILLSSEILELHNLNNDIYDYVCDITVDSPYQSFICGTPRMSGDVVFRGICVHNSSMGKQAVGIPGSNYMFKTKGIFHVMNYYQKQLIHTKMSKIMGFQHQPSGLNTIIFIGPLLGLNQEDSLAMNQDSVDRGFMTSTIYLPYDAKVRKDKGEIFEIPDEEECSNFHGNISKLGEDGIVREGECIAEGDILIGKTVCVDEDSSIYHKTKKNLLLGKQPGPVLELPAF